MTQLFLTNWSPFKRRIVFLLVLSLGFGLFNFIGMPKFLARSYLPPINFTCPLPVVLFTQYYRTADSSRNQHLDELTQMNMANHRISKFLIFLPLQEQFYRPSWLTGQFFIFPGQPTFLLAFSLLQASGPDQFYIFANSDILFTPEAIDQMCWRSLPDNVLALSRWELHSLNNLSDAELYDVSYSQDVWAWQGQLLLDELFDFPMGKLGSDNRIAWVLGQQRRVINPSRTIRTFHWHPSGHRTYNVSWVVPGELKFLRPKY